MSELNALLERASSPGDLAVVLVAATGGFVLDAWLDVISFLASGYVGVCAAGLALGVKKAVDATLANRASPYDRAVLLRDYLHDIDPSGYPLHRLEQELALHRLRVITDAELETSLRIILDLLRTTAADRLGEP